MFDAGVVMVHIKHYWMSHQQVSVAGIIRNNISGDPSPSHEKSSQIQPNKTTQNLRYGMSTNETI